MAALLLVLLALMLAGVAVGSTALPVQQILQALGLPMAQDAAAQPLQPMVERIIIDLRLPRVLLAVMTGAGLAMVGALLQTTTRNDLADPFLFGLSSGASAGAVLVITKLGDQLGGWALPLAAFAGGVVSAALVMLLYMQQRSRGTERIIISGLAISFFFWRNHQLSGVCWRPTRRQLNLVLVTGWAGACRLGQPLAGCGCHIAASGLCGHALART